MSGKITHKQFKELKEAYECLDDQKFVELLEKYTGITRKPYTSYSYFDEGGDYVGSSEDDNLIDILSNAYIEISDEVPKIKKCAVCGAPHVGVYCPNCGSGDYVETENGIVHEDDE